MLIKLDHVAEAEAAFGRADELGHPAAAYRRAYERGHPELADIEPDALSDLIGTT
jgi:hypothetical protein